MSIVSRISKCAKEKGLTIAEIERKCGFGANTMYRWDQNSPALEKVAKVANLIDTSIDYLATGENPSYNTLSDIDRELLRWIHMLDEETQRDFLGSIRLYVKQHPEDLRDGEFVSDAQKSQEGRMISSK